MTTAGTRPFGLASDGYPDMRLPPLIGSEPFWSITDDEEFLDRVDENIRNFRASLARQGL